MPRLGLSYDIDQFLDHCRMTKPPYECPHASCGKIYRSLAGIQHHMTSYDHENPPPSVVTPKSGRMEIDAVIFPSILICGCSPFLD